MFKATIVKSALILTLANIITRLLGFFYRIFMSNALGAEGMGLYQLISPIYMLVWAFTSAGLSTSVSKLSAEQRARGDLGNMKRLLITALLTTLVLSLFASLGVYSLSPYICTHFLKDKRTILSLKILSLCFPFMAVGSCVRGWFYGMQNTAVPAKSQVLEQCTRMAVVYILSFSMLDKGIESACAMAVIGMVMGEVIACIYALTAILLNKKYFNHKPLISYYKAGMLLFALAFPLTLNRITATLLVGIENFLIPSKLQLFGLTRGEAVGLYGQLCGMAMPLIMFPSSLLTALATALMPAVSEAGARGSISNISSAVEKSLAFTAVVGIGTAGLFLTLPCEIGKVVYNQTEIGYMLRLLGIVCPFIYLQVTLSGILNGLGKQLYIFIVNLISSIFNIGFICLFVPKYGIEAYIFGWFISACAVAVLSLTVTLNCIRLRLYLNNLILKPVVAIALSCLSLRFLTRDISLFSVTGLICSAAFIGGMYILLISLFGILPNKKII